MSASTRRDFLKTLALGAAGLTLPRFLGPQTAWSADSPGSAAKPNIIFILADDIGYGDLGCYGATLVKTPNVDKLASQGIRFTDAHASAAVCTPTRYGLMTGQYAWRNPAGSAILSGLAPLSIDTKALTLPAMLKQAGYQTGLVGKWHLGLGAGDLDYNKEIKPGPLEVGFDYAFFYPATGDRVPCVFVENRKVVGLDPSDPIRVSYGQKVGDEPTGAEHPELLVMKPGQGHNNTIVNGISRIGYMSGGKAARWNDHEMAHTLEKQAVGFIEKNKDKPFFLYLATHDIHVPRVPNKDYEGKSGCGLRGDAIMEFDATVGKVMEALERLKLADNTLLIVTSDNGGILNDGYNDGGIVNANGHKCNGALRGTKGSLFEGGTREPFIARWPGRIKPGTSDQMICTVDMLASFAALTGQKLPAAAAPDSFNVLPALLGEAGKAGRDHLVTQANGTNNLALRVGQWKYIPGRPDGGYGTPGDGAEPAAPAAAAKKGKAAGKGKAAQGKAGVGGAGQLFNLADDLGETKNVAAENPAKVKEMAALLEKIRQQGRSRA